VRDEEKRHNKRVKPPFVIRFRHIEGISAGRWDSAIPRNISETGMFFNSTDQFNAGAILQIKMKNYRLNEECEYRCKVIRSASVGNSANFYGTAVNILEMNACAKAALIKAIEYLNQIKRGK